MSKKKEIESSSLLMVEGKDECNFFKALFVVLGIDHVQIEDMGGKDRFDAAIRAFSKMQGFDDIVNIGFVRDAENTPASAAFMSVCGSLQHIDLQPPATIGKVERIHDKKSGIFIMPNNNNQGMLETVCLASIQQNTLYKDYILPYTDHLTTNVYANNSQFNRAKSEVQIYLASKVPLVNSLGLGAVNGYWDFNHPAFDEIKQFLRDLFGDNYEKASAP